MAVVRVDTSTAVFDVDHNNISGTFLTSEFRCLDDVIKAALTGGFNALTGDFNASQDGSGDENLSDVAKPWPLLKQPAYSVALLSVAYVLVAVVGLVSNTLVVTVFYRQPKMRSVTNYFLSNLAVADVLVCIFVLPITLIQSIFTEWLCGPILCKAIPYLQGVAVSASVNTLAAVAVERFLAIFYPQTSKMTSRTAVVIICFIWIVPAMLFIPWIVVYREMVFPIGRFDYVTCHADWTTDDQNRSFTLGVVFFTCYLLPLVSIGIFYLMIAVRVWRRKVRGTAGSRVGRNIHRSKTKILTMLAVVFVVFTLSWLPLYCLSLRLIFGGEQISFDEKQITRNYLLPVAQWLGASNSCVNPFIYCCFSQQFRKSIVDVMTTIRRGKTSTMRRRSMRPTDDVVQTINDDAAV